MFGASSYPPLVLQRSDGSPSLAALYLLSGLDLYWNYLSQVHLNTAPNSVSSSPKFPMHLSVNSLRATCNQVSRSAHSCTILTGLTFSAVLDSSANTDLISIAVTIAFSRVSGLPCSSSCLLIDVFSPIRKR